MCHNHYDGDDRESVLMNLKDHKPKSAKGCSLYSVIYFGVLKPARTDRLPPSHDCQWAGVARETVELLPSEDSGLHEVVAQTRKISAQNATRHAKRKKRPPCCHKSETNAEPRKKKKNQENGDIVDSLIFESTLNSVIINRGHPLCANGFKFRPLLVAHSHAI